MTKREKQLQLLRRKIKRAENDREIGIKLLVRATLELPKLRKQEARLEVAIGKRRSSRMLDDGAIVPDTTPVYEEPEPAPLAQQVEAIEQEMERDDDDLEIPAALDRNRKLQTLPDPKTKEKKAERRVIEKEVREAKLRGQTRKWPATGRGAANLLK